MRRRGNKSSKVPNVKLRPAQEGALPRLQRTDSSACWAEDSQLGSDDTNILDLCPRPFKGVVLCATGVIDKPTLFKQALELGATSMTAFTDRVTHLVAVDHGGAKYMCALERKIPILKPSWITENYQIWLRGDDVDFEESIKQHRLPIFSGVLLCPSGITDITRRTRINKLLTEHEGVYLKNLERPVKVTHLLCSGDEETEKMRYAEKFNSRGEANVHLVWEEWFWDSLEFGGRFDEQKYQVRRPRPAPKSLPEAATSPPPSSAVFSEADNETEPHDLKNPAPPQNQDDTEDELAAVRRLPAATLQLWGSLLGRRGYEISDGELIRSPSKVAAQPIPQPSPVRPNGNGSLISQFRRSNSFAPARPEVPSSGRPQPFRRSRTTSAMNTKGTGAGSFMASAQPEKNGESSTSAAVASGIFAGLKFIALGEARSPSVRGATEENGGRMMLEMDDDDVDYIIVRLVSGSKLYRAEADNTQRAKYRTECWLERCIFEDRVCSVEDHISFLPLSIQTPVAGAEKVTLSFSGLDQSEACWITRLLRALGMNLAQFFSRRSTHLLCPSGTGAKFDKACEWGVPVVTMEWLATVARTGNIPPASQFLVPGFENRRIVTPLIEESMDVDLDSKGKGKAVDKGKGRILVEDSATETMTSGGDDDSYPVQSPNSRGGRSTRGLSRQKSTSSPHRVPLEVLPFGRPTGALASQAQQRQSSVTTPTRSKSNPVNFPFGKPIGALAGTAITPTRTRSAPAFQTPTHPRPNLPPKAPSAPPASSSDPARQPTPMEIEREKKQARIPSSKSPSPMKIPRQPPMERPLTDSPTKHLPKEVAKALEANIATLLGKRHPPEDPAQNTRPGKRPRAQRPKAQSRQPSDAQLSEISAVPISAYDSMSPFETFDELNLLDMNVKENSMRVTYEDPGQQAEKKRLMSLLNVAPAEGSDGRNGAGKGSGTGVRTRKSSRIAGF